MASLDGVTRQARMVRVGGNGVFPVDFGISP
jgi:hypothetical protein